MYIMSEVSEGAGAATAVLEKTDAPVADVAEAKVDPKPAVQPADTAGEDTPSSEAEPVAFVKERHVQRVAGTLLFRRMESDHKEDPFASLSALHGLPKAFKGGEIDYSAKDLWVHLDRGKTKIMKVAGVTADKVTIGYGNSSEPEIKTFLKEDVPLQALVEARIVSDADSILAQFEGPQREVIATHIDGLRAKIETGTYKLSDTPAELVHTLVEVGKQLGFPTNEMARNFINNYYSQIEKTEGKLDLKHQIQKESALRLFEDETLADPGSLVELFTGPLGLGPERIQQMLAETVSRLEDVDKLLSSGRGTKEEVKQWKDGRDLLQAQKKAYIEIAQNLSAEGNIFTQAISDIENGRLDKQTAQEVWTAFATGDIETMFNVVYKYQERYLTDSQTKIEEREKLEKRRNMFRKGGIGVLGLLALLGLIIKRSTGGQETAG